MERDDHKADLQIGLAVQTPTAWRACPPGPIASPGRASLDASATRPMSEDLYFVSRNDGTHAFATTLAEHKECGALQAHKGRRR